MGYHRADKREKKVRRVNRYIARANTPRKFTFDWESCLRILTPLAIALGAVLLSVIIEQIWK